MNPIIVDYDKLRTPFYEISISDPFGKRKVDLPHHILRLITKIEIREALSVPESPNETTAATITFIEGSREPGSHDSLLGTAGLYQIPDEGDSSNTEIAGSITNRAGSILDLRFSGNNGITFLDQEEKETGKLSSTIVKNVDGKRVTRKYKEEPINPKFLLEAANIVTITWGYLEDSTSHRRISLSITSVESNFNDTSPTTVTVQCADFGPFLKQFTPKNAIRFGDILPSDKGAAIVFKDLKTDELLKKIAKETGWTAFISKNLLGDTLDKDKQKIWLADESFHDFLTRLAERSNCFYKVVIDPSTLKPVLFFIKKDTLDANPPIAKDKYFYLEYKHPGSLIKSITINAAFINANQAAVSSIDDTGEIVEYDSEVVLVQSKNKEGKITNPPHPAMGRLVKKVLGGNFTGRLDITPNSNSDFIKAQSDRISDIINRNVTIEIVTLGYPRFIPGTYPIRGIGQRFSGLYRAYTVSHIIDNTGYITTITGVSHSLESENKNDPEAKNAQEKEQTLDVVMSSRAENGPGFKKVEFKSDEEKLKSATTEGDNLIIDEDNITIKSFQEIYGKGNVGQ